MTSKEPTRGRGEQITRRKWLALVLMGTGLALSYGTLLVEGLLFRVPGRLKPLAKGSKRQGGRGPSPDVPGAL